MSVGVVIFVAFGVFVYTRLARKARRKWLTQIDLPGLWHWRDGEGHLRLSGAIDKGSFELREDQSSWSGQWRMRANTLVLMGEERTECLGLNLFAPGSIGLEDEKGVRRVFQRQASNVVSLRDFNGGNSSGDNSTPH